MANYFLNKTNKAKFTQMLAEFVCNKKCGLQSALELLSRNKNKKSRKNKTYNPFGRFAFF